MNKFPWWDASLTIYNRYENTQTHIVTWFRHVVGNCFWSNTGNKVSINDITLDTNSITARIPKDAAFLDRYAWEQLPNDSMSDYFTLSAGDIIVKGAVEDEINEYIPNHRSSDLLEKYKRLDGCMIIDRYVNNTGAGRGQPHYHVTGK